MDVKNLLLQPRAGLEKALTLKQARETSTSSLSRKKPLTQLRLQIGHDRFTESSHPRIKGVAWYLLGESFRIELV